MRDFDGGHLHDLGSRERHPLAHGKSIDHLPIHIEFLVLGNLELLVLAVLKGQDYAQRRGDCPNLPRNICTVVMVMGVVVVVMVRWSFIPGFRSNAELLTIYRHFGTCGTFFKIADRPSAILIDQVVARDRDNFATFTLVRR